MLQWLVSILIFTQILCLIQFWRIKQLKKKPATSSFQPGRKKLALTKEHLSREIKRHQETEDRLQNTQIHLQCLIDSMPGILVGVSPEGLVTLWNKSAEAATGYAKNEACGEKIHEIYAEFPASTHMIQQILVTGQPRNYKNLESGKGSKTKFTDLTIYPLLISEKVEGVVMLAEDVSQKVRMENKIIHDDKMLSLGEMAAGLAHELNNPLAGILHNLGNVTRRLQADNETNLEVANEAGLDLAKVQDYCRQRNIYSFVDNARIGGERATQIVNNMLNFARRSPLSHSKTDLRQIIEYSLELARNTLNPDSAENFEWPSIEKNFADNLPQVYCAPVEIQQVVINLLRNSTQALKAYSNPGKEKHRISLSLSYDKKNIYLKVKDNGPGINKDIRKHIFEPFFTTKDTGEGTGLGLSVCYFIITEHHNGRIEVDSQKGKGTTFIISLPLAHIDHPHTREEKYPLLES